MGERRSEKTVGASVPARRGLAALLVVTTVLPVSTARAAAVGEGDLGADPGASAGPGAELEPPGSPRPAGWPGALAQPLRAPTGEDPADPADPAASAAPLTAVAPIAEPETKAPLAIAAAVGEGESKPATTSQAIPLPTAEGSVKGMGESFTPDLAAGSATFTVPLVVPPGRAGVQPALALTYRSTQGQGPVGLGWTLDVPLIARQTDRGLPRYVDGPTWQLREDRFIYAGAELVPVDAAAIEVAECGAPGCAPVPAELAGWPQYRARIEGGFMRFFRAPDGQRWVVQAQGGMRYDFGVLAAGDGPAELATKSRAALKSEGPGGTGRIAAWLLTRATDAHGSPIYYLYDEDDGERYLADVFYTSPHAACGGLATAAARRRCAAPLTDYGRRIRLVYETRPDVLTSFQSGWAVRAARRLRRIEMTAAGGAPGQRQLVRRYHVGYDPGSFWSLLTDVTVEGRPAVVDPVTLAVVGRTDVAESSLGNATVGQTAAPMRFRYGTQPLSVTPAIGFGGADGTVHASPASPPVSVGADADLFDVNSDGLPDLVVTDPARYPTADGTPGAGVFWNGFGGAAALPSQAGAFSAAVPVPVPLGLAQTMRLSNANVTPMDVDGDGRSDYLHLPRRIDTGWFTPIATSLGAEVSPRAQGWRFVHLPRTLPAGDSDPRVDFAHDAARLRAFDVNGDHLVDIVRTTGTSIQIWQNLGWEAGGDGRYGSATWDPAAGRYQLSTAPIETCLPSVGTPLDFADPGVRLGDMNGDGLTDIVRLRAGSVIYWPGRGAGGFGVGAAACPAGVVPGRHVTVAGAPAQLGPDLAGVHLADVNADGVDDIVQVRTQAVDLWFGRAGAALSGRVELTGTPFAPSYDDKVRLVDVDGSGTIDILYAQGGAWRWLDPMGGKRPRLLTAIENPLGGATTIEYGTSSEDYLADLAVGHAWKAAESGCDQKVVTFAGVCGERPSQSPVISTVVRKVSTVAGLDRLGLPDRPVVLRYRYHDAYYEGIDQEVRGFGGAEVIHVGDDSEPTMIERTWLHLGGRAAAIASDRLADNPDEALKGRVYRRDTVDATGRARVIEHTGHELRRVLTGRSGVPIWLAVPIQVDTFRFDGAAPLGEGETVVLPDVRRDDGSASTRTLRLPGANAAHLRTTSDQIDAMGRVLEATAYGRLRGEAGEPLGDERIVSHTRFVNVPGSDSGFLFRATRTFTSGHGDDTPLADTWTTSSSEGDPIAVVTALSQPITPRFDGDAVAEGFGTPAPEDLRTSTTFDPWGNPLRRCAGGDAQSGAGCLRLNVMTYDPDYALVPAAEQIATARAGAGFRFLTTSGDWDRGLMAIVRTVDAGGAVTRATYDGFGRPTTLRVPPVVGCAGDWPTARIDYLDRRTSADPPATRVHTTRFVSCTDAAQTTEEWSFVDGLGRRRARLATGPSLADGTPWVRSELGEHNTRGALVRSFQPSYYDGSPDELARVLARPGQVPASQTRYDAFGRVIETIAEDGARTVTVHHALSVDVYDPLDLDSTDVAAGTPTTTRSDGHDRVIDTILRNRQPGGGPLEIYRLFTRYRADGKPILVERAQTQTDAPRGVAPVVAGRTLARHFVYDSVGRLIAATDPDSDDPATGATWRYLYNRVGDRIAERDPRGCGQNHYVDFAGRPLARTYVSCAEAPRRAQVVANLAAGIGRSELTSGRMVDVLHTYDDYEGAWSGAPQALPDYPGGVAWAPAGRRTATIDRGRRSVFAYDARGNPIWQARQLALIGVGEPAPGASPPLVVFDETRTYAKSSAYDHANRPGGLVLPADVDRADAPRVIGRLRYDRRGLPESADLILARPGPAPHAQGGAFSPAGAALVQPIIKRIDYTRDGLVERQVLGDDAGGGRRPTETTMSYDVRRRPIQLTTVREAQVGPGDPDPLARVTVVHGQRFGWDQAANLRTIDDLRVPSEWPAGHRPQHKTIVQDALYHVAGVDYDYSVDSTTRSPFDAETDWRAEVLRVGAADPMALVPAPRLGETPDDRVVSQTWSYDWLGNMSTWSDDAHAFAERSIGAIVNGADVAAPARPSALYLAADLGGPPARRGGWLEVDYGAGGQVSAWTLHGQCTDRGPSVCADPGGSLATRRAALTSLCRCLAEQRFEYTWDEVGRLDEARRLDRAGDTGPFSIAVRQRYRYDADNVRTVKLVDGGPGAASGPLAALYVFPGDHERRGLVPTPSGYSSELGPSPEDQYQVAGARIVWQPGDPMVGLDPDHRVSLPVRDLLGTTSAVIDLRSGALTEAGTFYPNGQRETLLGTSAELVPFEPTGFTGKEDDQAVGLVYFGERYLMPALARWASPDPLQTLELGGGEALNSYHYVRGSLLQARDPLGLEPPWRGPAPSFPKLPEAPKTPPKGKVIYLENMTWQSLDWAGQGMKWLSTHNNWDDLEGAGYEIVHVPYAKRQEFFDSIYSKDPSIVGVVVAAHGNKYGFYLDPDQKGGAEGVYPEDIDPSKVNKNIKFVLLLSCEVFKDPEKKKLWGENMGGPVVIAWSNTFRWLASEGWNDTLGVTFRKYLPGVKEYEEKQKDHSKPCERRGKC
jgi:RHS repeat-associated protein